MIVHNNNYNNKKVSSHVLWPLSKLSVNLRLLTPLDETQELQGAHRHAQ